MRFSLLVLWVLLQMALTWGFCRPSHAEGEAVPQLQIRSLKVCFVIYRIGSKGQSRFSDEDVLAVRAGGELARLFYFRNTRARLNLDIEYILLDAPLPRDDSGVDRPFEADLRAKGAKDNSYDLLFITGPDTNYNLGGANLLGNVVGAIGGNLPMAPLGNFPENLPGVNYGIAWVFAHEIHHAIERLFWNVKARPILHCHPYSDQGQPHFKGPYLASREFDWVALTLRDYPGDLWLKNRGVLDEKIVCADNDGDGFPDNEPRLPMDEARFGTDNTASDSEGDGFSDLDEFCAGIYGGSDPWQADSDGDGQSDKDDPFPLLKFADKMPYLRTENDAIPLFPAPIARTDGGGVVAVYGGWNEAGLHFWFFAPRPMKVLLDLDGSAQNGFWKGGDSYVFALSEKEGARFNGIGLEGRVEGATGHRVVGLAGGYGLQVSLPVALGQGISQEINYGGKRQDDDISQGLKLAPGGRIALGIAFDFEDSTRALLTPNYTLYPMTLGAK